MSRQTNCTQIAVPETIRLVSGTVGQQKGRTHTVFGQYSFRNYFLSEHLLKSLTCKVKAISVPGRKSFYRIAKLFFFCSCALDNADEKYRFPCIEVGQEIFFSIFLARGGYLTKLGALITNLNFNIFFGFFLN